MKFYPSYVGIISQDPYQTTQYFFMESIRGFFFRTQASSGLKLYPWRIHGTNGIFTYIFTIKINHPCRWNIPFVPWIRHGYRNHQASLNLSASCRIGTTGGCRPTCSSGPRGHSHCRQWVGCKTYRGYALPERNIAPEIDSYWKPSFLGAMLVLGSFNPIVTQFIFGDLLGRIPISPFFSRSARGPSQGEQKRSPCQEP